MCATHKPRLAKSRLSAISLNFSANAVGSFMRTATAALATMSTAARVETPHAYTGRMCAASRFLESQRADALFNDHLAHRLAGDEGLAGRWAIGS